jgi:hypothetical protein
MSKIQWEYNLVERPFWGLRDVYKARSPRDCSGKSISDLFREFGAALRTLEHIGWFRTMWLIR